MKIIVLASGSKGNATYIKTENASLMIDAGISYRQIKMRMQTHQLDPSHLDAVLLTHEHSDHVKGLSSLLKFTDAKLYTPLETFNHLYEKATMELSYAQYERVEPEQGFWIHDIHVTPIPVSHDAQQAVGYILEHNDKKLVYMTDVGYVPESDYPKIQNADMYIFEANYDVSLLFSSERPYYLKKRIDSIKGHLSNADSAYHLTRLIGDNTKTIVLAHPSEECNTEFHVLETFKDVFTSYDINLERFDIVVAKQHQPTKLMNL